jgi:protein-S-isoprenylcysteine O-methyltransferase Ste14
VASALSRGFTVLRGIVFSAGFVWLWTWVALWVRSFDTELTVALPEWLRPLGLVLAFGGALLAGACIATFVTRGRGTPAPFDPPREFVASGPYRYVRNPMYIGGALVILGAGFILLSPAIVLLAAGFLLVMHLIVVLHEEPVLAKRFGASYERYKAAVRRWLIRKPH